MFEINETEINPSLVLDFKKVRVNSKWYADGRFKILEINSNHTQADIENNFATWKAEYNTAQENQVDHKASGNQKLLDLGLSQAEATALTGYTPPTEV